MSEFFYTQPTQTSGDNFTQLNEMINQNAGRLQRAMAQDQALKNARARQQASELQAARKSAAEQRKRVDGYDSSVLIPPFRDLFNQYKQQQLESINYFMTDDEMAVDTAVNNIAQFYTTYAAHTQNESVVSSRDRTLELASDATKRQAEEESYSSVTMLDLDMSKYVAMEQYHNGGFATGYELVGNQIYATGKDGYMPVENMSAFKNPKNFQPAIGTKPARSLNEFAVGRVRDAAIGTNSFEWTPESDAAAINAATALVRSDNTNEGLEVRRRIAEDYWGQEHLRNKDLVNAYMQNERDAEGNFINETARAYQERLLSWEAEAISSMHQMSIVDLTDPNADEQGSDRGDGSMTVEQVRDEVFQDIDAKFRPVENIGALFGSVDALAMGEGRGLPYGSFFNLERIRMDRKTINVENPLYTPVTNEAGELIYPEGVNPVVKVSPSDLVIIPNQDGGYQVIIENITVDGSEFSAAVFDHEIDRDVMADLDFYINEVYDRHIGLQDLVDAAIESKARFGQQARGARGGETGTGPQEQDTQAPATTPSSSGGGMDRF